MALIETSSTSDFSGAACRGSDVDLYHPSDRQRPQPETLAGCARCGVRLDCLAVALRAEDPQARSGWYGGFGPEDRDAIAALLPLPRDEALSDRVRTARRLVDDGWLINDVAELLGCSRRTVQRYLR
ncbi:WhiB family transcriptional regulator [Streptomyces antimicrobicus]|uniref:WhiB family transcriptional regulator n=1 Tax=Streptomyces antimicrobicus TaxID=2883108 RepID=A0ABS8B911_9ACTN|nr:WhiB family transcriptional regulator [Streptomyces antimicrobicus]MCB5181108.1 WhiB family transcriptional regulator [Streptomyces antimicrobicus]